MSSANLSSILRRQVAEDGRFRCSYCQSQEDIAGMRFTIDHIIPKSLGGTDEMDNLCLACWDCNLAKHNHISAVDPESGELVHLFHPHQHRWVDHFEWSEDQSEIIGLTATGRATINQLHLNREWLVQSRLRWTKVGWHPPVD